MSNQLKDLRNTVAASIYLKPCTLEELMGRDFLKSRSRYGVELMLMELERQGALYYREGKMHIKKKWGKKNLLDFDLDFRTQKEREQDGWTSFKKELVNRLGL